jgi:hypothetical protein
MPSGSMFPQAAVIALGIVVASLMTMAASILRGRRLRQEWGHAERMKALEMGIYVPPRESPWPRAVVCLSIGVIVPLGAFVCAWLTTITAPMKMMEQGVVWGVAFLVSTTAIGCATSLAPGLPGSTDRAEPSSTAKPPAFDPESFEAASRHG